MGKVVFWIALLAIAVVQAEPSVSLCERFINEDILIESSNLIFGVSETGEVTLSRLMSSGNVRSGHTIVRSLVPENRSNAVVSVRTKLRIKREDATFDGILKVYFNHEGKAHLFQFIHHLGWYQDQNLARGQNIYVSYNADNKCVPLYRTSGFYNGSNDPGLDLGFDARSL